MLFETALEKAGVEPGRSLMIGDRFFGWRGACVALAGMMVAFFVADRLYGRAAAVLGSRAPLSSPTGLPVVMVVGNNGVWGLEKHPMRFLFVLGVG